MPLQTLLFLLYIAIAAAVSFQNWRAGPFLIVLSAAIQDPIRKTTPGVPAWMVLGTAFIFAAWAIGFVTRHPGWWWEFSSREPLLARAVEIFAIGLIIPIVIDLQYGVSGVKLIILGMLFYGVGLANLVLGFYYGGDAGMVRRLFRFYCIVTCVMLTGVLLEYKGLYPTWYALGSEALGTTWIRHIPGHQVQMFAGFYRSPDIMGWHTTMASLLALVLGWLLYNISGRMITGLYSQEFVNAPWSLAKFGNLMSNVWFPIIIIGIGGTAGLIRTLRATLLDELRKPYVTTGRAKGLTETRLLLKYPIRIAMNPVFSTIGWILPGLINGGVIVGIVLNLQTIGPVLMRATLAQDMYLAGSIVLILSALTVVGTFISDILLAWLDPRIRLQ